MLELTFSCQHTQRNIFEILLNQLEIRLYLSFSDWFGTKRTSVWFQINWKKVNTIWFRFDLIRFWKDFSVCEFRAMSQFASVQFPSGRTGTIIPREANLSRASWGPNWDPLNYTPQLHIFASNMFLIKGWFMYDKYVWRSVFPCFRDTLHPLDGCAPNRL